jgi:hypothetical protein
MMTGVDMETIHDEMRAVSQAVVRLHATVLAVVGAVVTGMGLFIITVWLVLKGGPQVGVHLELLKYYFIGYSVSWSGSLLGLCYGALLGGVMGWSVGKIYNGVLLMRQDRF